MAMISFQNLKNSHAARNAAASYLAFASSAVCGLVSIPIAVSYLNKTQMGLWSIVFTIVGYLLWLDLGIGNATGRKIAAAILADDQREINRWWTLSIGVLALLGGVMFLASLFLSPFLTGLLNIPSEYTGDTLWLFLGMTAVSAVGMPFRAYPGLLIAQERFHWVPLVQALMPWLQLGCFWGLLSLGFGVRSYFPALAFSQATGWVIYVWKVHGKGFRIRIDFSGWTKSRFHELFSYSSSLAVIGIVESVLQSLPALLLARLGGLPLVPVYNLTNRGPGMLHSVAQRTTYAFFPNLQKLYVSGKIDLFGDKFRKVNQLGVWVGLIGAGGIIAGNRPLVCWLAKLDFYAGGWTNLWFACWMITFPFVNGISDLFQLAGKMGKTAGFAMLELPLGVALCWMGFHFGGMPGIAAAFALLPLLVRAPYSLYAGPRFCGFKTWSVCGNAVVALIVGLSLILIGGAWSASGSEATEAFDILGRTTYLPTFRELAVGIIAIALGSIQAIRCLLKIRNGVATPLPAL
ncbi:lipopolysaccharide biosynthesis protein [Luteolibacter algae]|uniref:Lipopolysaccharide biosynthesis protein n=1 Tax=Luteolibacter algae TaxID=454151 RepID=A0ABW5D471_9BACT